MSVESIKLETRFSVAVLLACSVEPSSIIVQAVQVHCSRETSVKVCEGLLSLKKMGNQATKVSEQASETASSIKKRLTIRRRRPEIVGDFTSEDIKKKFDGIPILTVDEKQVLKSSWALIVKKIDVVSTNLDRT